VILRSSGIDTINAGGINTNLRVDTTAREAAEREFRVLFLSDGTANVDLPHGGLGGPVLRSCSALPAPSWRAMPTS
jgi:hypothetical protein